MRTAPIATRTCCLACRDWPVVAAVLHGRARPAEEPLIVRERAGARDVVRAASPAARAEGVVVGMRRREAEARCPGAVVLDADLAEEARTFEAVARAVESLTPRLEVEMPGVLSFPTRGPSRYYGGDDALGARVIDVVRGALAGNGQAVRAGIADGRFAARLAAHRARARGDEPAVLVVPPGEAAAFVAPFPVGALGDPALAELLVRLGLPTLGAFAALPAAAVLARFGNEGARLHALANGADYAQLDLATAAEELAETIEFEPPAQRVDTAAFAAKTLADSLLARLAERALVCTSLVVEAETEHGERLARRWRHQGAFTPAALAERVRWQLDAWLAAGSALVPVTGAEGRRAHQDVAALADAGLDTTTGALTSLRLVADEVCAASGRQLGFWGGDQAAADRADRALARVQGMLGFGSVVTVVAQGGRTPVERARAVPWGEPREPGRVIVSGREVAPWPGSLPAPAPARLFDPPVAAELLDDTGRAVVVSGRGEASAPPASLRCALLPGNSAPVVGWAGPWAHDVRWWDHRARRRRVLWQIQVRVAEPDPYDIACLVAVESGRAGVEAIYD